MHTIVADRSCVLWCRRLNDASACARIQQKALLAIKAYSMAATSHTSRSLQRSIVHVMHNQLGPRKKMHSKTVMKTNRPPNERNDWQDTNEDDKIIICIACTASQRVCAWLRSVHLAANMIGMILLYRSFIYACCVWAPDTMAVRERVRVTQLIVMARREFRSWHTADGARYAARTKHSVGLIKVPQRNSSNQKPQQQQQTIINIIPVGLSPYPSHVAETSCCITQLRLLLSLSHCGAHS